MNAFTGIDGEILRRQCKRDYATYVKTVNEGFCVTKFHRYICNKIQEFLTVKTGKAFDILLLSVPPRHGKSYTVTETLPSWFLGNNPRGEVIICSYQSTFAENFSKANRDKFNKYGPLIFRENGDRTSQSAELWKTEQGGKCRAAGLEAGITGFGAELFIIDDPIKNAADASSEVIIKKILAEMGPSVQSRIYPGGKLIVIQTRWVENDVIGYIKDNWSEFVWADINLPCEYDDEAAQQGPCPLGRKLGDSLMGPHLGDPVLPQKIANDNSWLKSKKMVVMAAEGERVWNSLYQGRPTAAAGNLFDTTWFKTFKRSEFVIETERPKLSPMELSKRKEFEYLQLSIDASFKGEERSDFVAMGIRGIYRGDIYLYYQLNKRLSFVETISKIKELARKFPEIDELVLEDKANGPAIADVLRYMDGIPPVVSVNPLGGKSARAQAITPFIEAGHYYIAEDLDEEEVDWHVPTNMTAREKILTQHKSFPFGKHDDMVDENSQGTIRLIKLITGEEPKPERRFLRYVKWYPDMWEDFEQMNAEEQKRFIQTYGAPLEWAD